MKKMDWFSLGVVLWCLGFTVRALIIANPWLLAIWTVLLFANTGIWIWGRWLRKRAAALEAERLAWVKERTARW